ncbi:hypothetical protein Q7C36_003238 [Tachysurus vachellii]|uniref:Platelet-derived growth factor (PDGF) family profile domain-containing protein n=1 Tax=Tachysurus vachellii TaxID=175792 RepID=A0AA88NV51_TACVA|nr:hypothetical protein Q7C36_003238 [Tachysurus vachellii]
MQSGIMTSHPRGVCGDACSSLQSSLKCSFGGLIQHEQFGQYSTDPSHTSPPHSTYRGLGHSNHDPIQWLVEVEQEYPGVVEYIFNPRCVPLHRCAGCCNDEQLLCSPTRRHNVTIQLVRINPVQRTKQYVELSFSEHCSCECRPKQNHIRYQRQKLSRPYRRRKGKKDKKRTENTTRCHHFS